MTSGLPSAKKTKKKTKNTTTTNALPKNWAMAHCRTQRISGRSWRLKPHILLA